MSCTEGGVVSQLVAVAQHAVSQQTFRLGVAGGLHLPPDLGHRVQHVQLCSRGYKEIQGNILYLIHFRRPTCSCT